MRERRLPGFGAKVFRVLGFRVLGFRVLGFRVLGFRVLGFRVLGFRVVCVVGWFLLGFSAATCCQWECEDSLSSSVACERGSFLQLWVLFSCRPVVYVSGRYTTEKMGSFGCMSPLVAGHLARKPNLLSLENLPLMIPGS